MNKQELISAVQSLIDDNRCNITCYHSMVADSKRRKRYCDEAGDLEGEYFHHNQLQLEKEYVRVAVRNQKALKYILQELYAAEEVV